jgi:hypothetical protein
MESAKINGKIHFHIKSLHWNNCWSSSVVQLITGVTTATVFCTEKSTFKTLRQHGIRVEPVPTDDHIIKLSHSNIVTAGTSNSTKKNRKTDKGIHSIGFKYSI